MDSQTGKSNMMGTFIRNGSEFKKNIQLVTYHLMRFSVFSNSKIQKYSPTESAKVYDKAVNRKNNIHFHPRQTLDFIQNNMAQASLTNEIKRHVVRQYLDVSHQRHPFGTMPLSETLVELCC